MNSIISITLKDHHFSVMIIRTTRKTTRLKIISASQLEVRAPLTKSDREIEELLYKQSDWITSRLPKLTMTISQVLPEKLLLRGKELSLQYHIKPDSKVIVTHNEETFILTYPPETPAIDLRYAIIQYYRQLAKTILTERTQFWAEKINVTVNRITIKEQQTRWGSCSHKHNVNYNWHIIEAPDEVIDYLVIHELCHLHHMNHWPSFWKTVATFDPKYMEHDRYLKNSPSKLSPLSLPLPQ